MTPFAEQDVRIVPANEASWADLEAVFGEVDRPSVRRVVMRVDLTAGVPRASTVNPGRTATREK
ncbi:hypothetical protein ACFYOT_37855 [Saccharothrix saharensis]|uniref:hypothetical protein n=1 Tax=Saccharothrix saharensis TaxID=571190 RepID=UPI00369CEECA